MTENIEKISILKYVDRDDRFFEKRKQNHVVVLRKSDGESGSDSINISDEARRLFDEEAAADEAGVK
jgi:hypothetical protein